MLLLLIRHAQAADQDEVLFPDDTLRPLVPKGRKAQRRISGRLRKRGLVPSVVYSSPWKRAWQTARIVVEETGVGKSARFPCEALAAPPDLPALAAEIGPIGSEDTIGLVGHAPWMSELASLFLTGTISGVRIDFPKSGILGIEAPAFEAGEGTLRFFWTP